MIIIFLSNGRFVWGALTHCSCIGSRSLCQVHQTQKSREENEEGVKHQYRVNMLLVTSACWSQRWRCSWRTLPVRPSCRWLNYRRSLNQGELLVQLNQPAQKKQLAIVFHLNIWFERPLTIISYSQPPYCRLQRSVTSPTTNTSHASTTVIHLCNKSWFHDLTLSLSSEGILLISISFCFFVFFSIFIFNPF